MSTRQLPVLVSLAMLTFSVVLGAAQCPGGVETIRYHPLEHSQMGVSVTINRSGPYEFILDTGSQITIIEPSLATELHLASQADIGVVSDVRQAVVELVRLDLTEVGRSSVRQLRAAVQSLAQIQVANPRIRGILGENFLFHFDFFVDHPQKFLCLDESQRMLNGLEGERLPLVMKPGREWGSPFPQPLLISVQLLSVQFPANGPRGVILRLDSGANLPQLYVNKLETAPWVQRRSALRGRVTGNAEEYFALMPSQDVRIGRHVLRDIVFATPVMTGHEVAFAMEDGLLPMNLFKRVFISHAGCFVVFNARWLAPTVNQSSSTETD